MATKPTSRQLNFNCLCLCIICLYGTDKDIVFLHVHTVNNFFPPSYPHDTGISHLNLSKKATNMQLGLAENWMLL